ncbi:uncharacterized protein LOC129592594 [Paramacrobiotus metropolitanus]|uniref:uncharacterized protein LOC129592594 n=1 Tax=Paramacrobiotus metropolitanus TaxID=2943436 RepID=UPI0024456F08|nr:uncharacterized protein LOC129592594 [Paramacrobiotus metropolitanus]
MNAFWCCSSRVSTRFVENMYSKSFLVFLLAGVALVAARRGGPTNKHHHENIQKIKEHFSKNNLHGAKWVPAENEFTGMDPSELKKLCGTRRPTKESTASDPHLAAAPSVKRVALPPSFDVRSKWPGCVSMQEIRDQGHCGSCWAHAGASALSDRYCIASGSANSYRKLSVQDLILCSGGDNQNWCDGNDPRVPYAMAVSTGIVTGGDYQSSAADQGCMPYVSYTTDASSATSTSQCTKTCANTAINYSQNKTYGSSWYALGNNFANNSGGAAASIATTDTVIHQIQYELQTNGPMTVAIDVYDDFFAYQSGVYQHVTGNYSGGHAMKLIGWGTENGTDYWLIANSWGYKWGINGTVKFLRGTNHLGIEDYIVAGLVSPTATAPIQNIPCDTNGCQGRVRYAMTSTNICSQQYCACSYQNGLWNPSKNAYDWVNVTAPKVFTCSAGQAFDSSASVLGCASTSTIVACGGTASSATNAPATMTPSTTVTTTHATTPTTPATNANTSPNSNSNSNPSSPPSSPAPPPSTTQQPAPLGGRPTGGFDWCDRTFCGNKTNGNYATAPCSMNYCSCSNGNGQWLGCGGGTVFDGNIHSCVNTNPTYCGQKPPQSGAPPPTNTAPAPAPQATASLCNVANCQLRDLPNNWWFSLGQCSQYWCYCDKGMQPTTAMGARLQTCPSGQLFDFRSEISNCKSVGQIPYC